jgi:hypothetical protein
MNPDATQTLFQQYATAVELLAKRMLGEPFNFHRIQDRVRPEMLDPANKQWRDIILECASQFERNGAYSAATIATSLSPGEIGIFHGYAMEHAEMDVVTAYTYFYDAYGRYSETQIMLHQVNWLLDGHSAMEMLNKAESMRRERGISAFVKATDGKAEFEAELNAAIEGASFEYPVKPFLKSMQKKIPYYEPSDYIVLAMLSGGGKSYHALNQILYSALQGVASTYINLENSPKNVQKRLWQMYSGQAFRRDFSYYRADEIEKIRHDWEMIKKLPYRSVNPGNSFSDVAGCIREERYERGIELAVVDYAQLMDIPSVRGARHEILASISAGFRALSLELNIPVMVLAQVKQEVMNRPDKRAGMYDIADAKNFTQDATTIILPYRPDYVQITSDDNGTPYVKGYADNFIAKGRETGRDASECRFNHILGFYDVPEAQNDFPDFVNQGNRDEPEF